MTESIKFTDQEIVELKDLQSEYQKVIYSWGQLQIERKILDAKEEEINSIYDSLSQKEKALMDSLNQKYGNGTLNLENGTFTPNN